jgi:isochorismate synthase
MHLQAEWDPGGIRGQIGRGIDRARALRRPVLVTRTVAIAPPEDILAPLERARAAGVDTVLWERPADRLAIAGIGAAWSASAAGPERFREVADACDALASDAVAETSGPLFLGGFSFAPEPPATGAWRCFPAARMTVPRVLVVRRENGASLSLNVLVDVGGDPEDVCRRLAQDLAWLQGGTAERESPQATSYAATPVPSQDRWKESVANAISDIRAGHFDKLVLARTCAVRSSRPFDAARIARRLRQSYPSCATFWLGCADSSFVGATPEPLVRLEDRVAHLAAIAGSIARGTTPGADRALARALMASAKDRHEHALVVRAIGDSIAPLCDRLDVPDAPGVLALANVQHLLTPITAHLAARCRLLDLVDRLHPTPAVAGHPRAAALNELRKREGMERGWYAGPIGWMDFSGNGEVAVAIRSALLSGSEATLYAGAGVVAGSDPEAELAETRLKLQPLLSALMEI